VDSHETKFKNTETRIQKAFLALLEKHDFMDITIQDVCREAGIYRSTFYSHYDNTRDLLNAVWKATLSSFASFTESSYKLDIPKEGWSEEISYFLISPTVLENYLVFVKEHRRLFLLYEKNGSLFEQGGNDAWLKELIIRPSFEAAGVRDPEQIRYLTDFYFTGVVAMVDRWVLEGCELPIDTLISYIRLALVGKDGADPAKTKEE
jgi:AcrR family transcriptional regulator